MQISHNDEATMKPNLDNTALFYNIMNTIRRAAVARQVVRITYTDAKGVMSVRNVEPYEFKPGKFFAFDSSKDSIRAFDLARISHAEITPQLYEPRFEIKIE